MIKNQFNSDIWRLNNRVVEFMLDVEKSVQGVGQSIRDKDLVRMKQLIDHDAVFNKDRDELENECLVHIMRKHPFAKDLRSVLAIFKLTTDIERIGDQVRDICEIMEVNVNTYSEKYHDIFNKLIELTDAVEKGFSLTIRAFATQDELSVAAVISGDDEIDELYNQLKTDIGEALTLSNANARELLALVGVVKHLEKIGDHCVNIVEWVHYIAFNNRKIAKHQ